MRIRADRWFEGLANEGYGTWFLLFAESGEDR